MLSCAFGSAADVLERISTFGSLWVAILSRAFVCVGLKMREICCGRGLVVRIVWGKVMVMILQ